MAFTAGFCWSRTNVMPSVADASVQLVDRSKSSPAPYSQDFPFIIENLSQSTSYYARTFYKIGSQITYGNQIPWTTATPTVPLTLSARSVGHNTVLCDVSVENISPALVKATGVCWSENPNPKITNPSAEMQGYNALATLIISNLKVSTRYFIRAYVRTDAGVFYGTNDKVIQTFKGIMVDVDGNVYNTVELGGTEWMASNLRVAKFNNGTPIPNISGATGSTIQSYYSSQTPFWCYYADNANYDVPFGKLYPRHVAQSANLPPAGWHIPTEEDWNALVSGSNGTFNLCAKDGSWGSTSPTDAFGFSLYPAGWWYAGFKGMGTGTIFWTSGPGSPVSIDYYSLSAINGGNGLYSVRFVKN